MNTPLESQVYLSWYALKDLDAPKARPVTRLVVLALGLMSGLLMVAAATALWIPAVQTARLERSPLAKSLWIGQPENGDKILTDERLKEITEKISLSTSPESIHAFKRFALKFRGKGNGKPEAEDQDQRRPQEWMGRTVEQGDPILTRLGTAATENGIVPTRELLDLLGFDAQEIPTHLAIRFQDDHQWQDVRVLFVTEVRFPYNVKFLVPRDAYNSFYLAKREVTWTGLDVGPIPAGWPTGGQLRNDEAFNAALQRWAVNVRIERRAGHFCYIMTLPNTEPKVASLWRRVLEEFRAELIRYQDERNRDSTQAKTMEILDRHDEVKPVLPPVILDLAEVRVRTLNDVKATALGCRQALYPADETLVSQVDQVHQIGRLLLLAFVAICLILLIIICLVIVIIQKLRCELKVPEIGMLKAMGISRAEFRRMFRHQALVLWGRSLLLAAAFTIFGGTMIMTVAGANLHEVSLLLAYSAGGILAVAAITAPLIVFSLRLATREARLSDPMESLSYG